MLGVMSKLKFKLRHPTLHLKELHIYRSLLLLQVCDLLLYPTVLRLLMSVVSAHFIFYLLQLCSKCLPNIKSLCV